MPKDNDVHLHGFNIAGSVFQGFPFKTLEEDAAKFKVSAESRFSASSKAIRVRVDGSKNRLTTVTPLSVGTLGIGRERTSRKDFAESNMDRISSGGIPERPRRCLRGSGIKYLIQRKIVT